MNTKDEIVYYCNEPHPVGALMLAGEWGCGKTYLIEHDVKEALKDTHIIVRISLFGISSLEELQDKVKKRWVEECAPFFKQCENNALMSVGQTIVSLFGDVADKAIEGSGKLAKAALSINPLDFIQIKPFEKKDGGGKRIVLVFDDLERSKLDTIDVLGSINDYCENQGFLVIIVVHEKKMNKSGQTFVPQINAIELDGSALDNGKQDGIKPDSNKNVGLRLVFDSKKNPESISYAEIKEKIVCRTIIYEPDYSQIIISIISDEQNGLGIVYSGFLKRYQEKIINLFEYDVKLYDDNNSTEINEKEKDRIVRPRNIRSLKCALHDFQRVYNVLVEENVPDSDIGDSFIAFVAYVLAAKANLLKKSDRYGYFFTDATFGKIYPFVNAKSLYRAEEDWGLINVWDEEGLRREIDERRQLKQRQEAAKQPKEILRLNSIFDVDDEDIKNGFPLLLEDCYKGKLDFNDYVQFICNAMMMRVHGFLEYEQIDWKKVLDGVTSVIEETKNKADYDDAHERSRFHKWIEEDFRKKFTECELKPYDEISRFMYEGGISFEKNRQDYLKIIKDGSIQAFALSKNKIFDRFDEEMAEATARCYKSCSQAEKNTFPNYFIGIWGGLEREKWFQKKATIAGLERLEKELSDLKEEYVKAGKKNAEISLDGFLKEVVRLKNKYSSISEESVLDSVQV